MPDVQPIATAPKDGSKVTVCWTDEAGQENRTIAQYRAPDRLSRSGGDWDEADSGWWAFIDGRTQKKIEPHGWVPKPEAS